MRLSVAIRATAWGMVAAGIAAPLLRRRLRAPPLAVQTVAIGAPLALSVAMRRSRARDVAVCCLQMWAYTLAYKSPHDDAEEQLTRVRTQYPIAVDRVLGLGELPTLRLQRRLAVDGRWTVLDRVLVAAHWSWFAVPHGALVYAMLRRPEGFERAAVLTYAVFDIGAVFYWILPTAPPWWAAARRGEDGDLGEGARGADADGEDARGEDGDAVEVRRLMVEYGEHLWGERWARLYSVFGGNPLAAMPSLHFATSVMAATLLDEVGPLAGAVGWAYALTLGFALVYLGEHYVADLIAGGALAFGVRRAAPLAAPALGSARRAIALLEAVAHGGA